MRAGKLAVGPVPGKKRLYIPLMRYVALAGARNQKFYPGLQVFLQQKHADIRPCALDRTEKTGGAPMTAMSYCITVPLAGLSLLIPDEPCI